MRVRSTVPALREGLEVVELRGRSYLEDPIRRVRVPLDDLSLRICEALRGGPLTPAELTSRVGAGRLESYERVALLNRHVMLRTPRAAQSLKLHGMKDQRLAPADGSLVHRADLRHSCTGCGACCTGTDLGPLSDEDVARIEAVDWTPHLPPEVTPDQWTVEVELQGGGVTKLLGRRNDRCVFLRQDNQCTIHAVAGAAQKPLMCRQFPHLFIREPESPSIHVGFATECRSWHVAKIDGASVEDSHGALWEILEEKGSAIVLKAPFSVWDGLDWAWATWRDVRDVQLERLKTATEFAELVDGIVEPVLQALVNSMSPHEQDEFFATRAGWGIPAPPGGSLTGRGAFEAFQEASQSVDAALGGGLDQLSERYSSAGELQMGRRHLALSDVVHHLFSGQGAPPGSTTPAAFEIWRDMALAAVDSHEIVQGDSILFETAKLVFKLVIAHHDCHLSVSDSMRARVDDNDVVDRMVPVTKMLRGALVSALLRRSRKEVVALFLFNTSVFVRGQAPRALGLEAVTRLPGELR